MSTDEPPRTADSEDGRADPCTPDRHTLTRFTTTVEHDPVALSGLRHTVRGWLSSTELGEQTVDDIVLAVSEAVSNAIDHSRADSHAVGNSPSGGDLVDPTKADAPPTAASPIEVELFCGAWTVTVTVVDHGRWRAPDRSDRSANRGRGMRIIQILMDSYEVHRSESGTIVTMTKRLTQTDIRRTTDSR